MAAHRAASVRASEGAGASARVAGGGVWWSRCGPRALKRIPGLRGPRHWCESGRGTFRGTTRPSTPRDLGGARWARDREPLECGRVDGPAHTCWPHPAAAAASFMRPAAATSGSVLCCPQKRRMFTNMPGRGAGAAARSLRVQGAGFKGLPTCPWTYEQHWVCNRRKHS